MAPRPADRVAPAAREVASVVLVEDEVHNDPVPSATEATRWLALRCVSIATMSRSSGQPAAQEPARLAFSAPDAIGGDGSLDLGRVLQLLRGRRSAALRCYEDTRREGAESPEYVALQFTVNALGRAFNVTHSGPVRSALAQCLMGTLASIEFPRPVNGDITLQFSMTACPALPRR